MNVGTWLKAVDGRQLPLLSGEGRILRAEVAGCKLRLAE
jgi:hypothetical protein